MMRGIQVATAMAALLAVTACGDEDDDTGSAGQDLVKCAGINECAGQSECAGGPGDSSCRGLGRTDMTGGASADRVM